MNIKRATTLVCIALITAACGSTVPAAQQAATTGVAQGGGLSGNSTLPPGAHVNSKGQIVNSKGRVIGTTGGSGSVQGETGGGAPGTAIGGGGGTGPSGNAAVSGAAGPGVSNDTIVLGLQTVTDASDANRALGAG